LGVFKGISKKGEEMPYVRHFLEGWPGAIGVYKKVLVRRVRRFSLYVF
jgi:hypothetical protein